MASAWYCMIDGTEYGPMSAADLKRLVEKGKLGITDQIKNSPTGKWVTASSVKGLVFKKEPAPSTSPAAQTIPSPAGKTCPSCKVSLKPEAVLCIQCGLDLRTGKNITQNLDTVPQECRCCQKVTKGKRYGFHIGVCVEAGAVDDGGIVVFETQYQEFFVCDKCARKTSRFSNVGVAIGMLLLGCVAAVLCGGGGGFEHVVGIIAIVAVTALSITASIAHLYRAIAGGIEDPEVDEMLIHREKKSVLATLEVGNATVKCWTRSGLFMEEWLKVLKSRKAGSISEEDCQKAKELLLERCWPTGPRWWRKS